MKNEERYIEIARKLFHHEYTEEELHQLLKQFASEKEREAFYKTVKHIWESTNENEKQISVDSEKLLEHILAEIQHPVKEKRDRQSKKVKSRSLMQKDIVRQFLKIAAVFIVAVLLFVGGHAIYKHHKSASCLCIRTPFGVKESIVLPDNSHVWLNSGSKLKYPKHFGKTRTIYLKGEAYFEITKDSLHPFIVHTRQVNVKVLGTGFNVTAYRGEKVAVTLVHGRVLAFHNDKKGNIKSEVILSPGEQSIFTNATKTFQVRKINTSDYTAWINGRLIFKNTPLVDVIKKLNRWYNVRIVINDTDKVIKQFDYTVEFNNDSLPTVLKILHEMTPVCFKQSGKKIFVTKDNKHWEDFIK